MTNTTPQSAPDALQDLHNELYRAQTTDSVDVLMQAIGKARILLARYRDSLAASAAAPTGLSRDAIQKKAIEHGFEYWRASDSHGVTGSKPQAIELLQDLIGVEVEIEDNGCSTCNGTGMIGGPSFQEPGEGGVPCPDCASRENAPAAPPLAAAGAAQAVAVADAPVAWLHYAGKKPTLRRVDFNAKPGAIEQASGWKTIPLGPIAAPAPTPEAAENELLACPHCDGSGEVMFMSDGGPDAYEVPGECPHCKGGQTLEAAYVGVVDLLLREENKYRETTAILFWGRDKTAAGRITEIAEYLKKPGAQLDWAHDRLLALADMAKVAAASKPGDTPPETGRGDAR